MTDNEDDRLLHEVTQAELQAALLRAAHGTSGRGPLRVCELIRVELEKARQIVPGPWTLAVAPDVHDQLCTELEMPYVDSLHGEHLRVAKLDEPDLVVLLPTIPVHVFTSEEALAVSRFQGSGRIRRLYIPSARLTDPIAVDAFQALRRDGVAANHAEEVAAVL